MSKKTFESLYENFGPISHQDWLELMIREQSKGVSSKTISQRLGMEISPYYSSLPNSEPFENLLTTKSAQPWFYT